jgi:diguanylate cyclase (GGDEF)-like protein
MLGGHSPKNDRRKEDTLPMQTAAKHPVPATRLLIACALAVVGAWSLAALRPASPLAPLLDALHRTAAFSVAAWFAWRGARAAPPPLRRVRTWFACGLALLAASQWLWDALAWPGVNSFPGLPNLLQLLLGPCFVAGFGAIAADDMPPAQRRSMALDVLGVGLAATAVTLALYLPHAGHARPLVFATLSAYPALLFAAATAGVVVQLHLRQRPTRATLAIVGGLVSYAGLWMAWNLTSLDGQPHPDAGMALLFPLLALVLGWGSARWRPERDPAGRHDRRCEGLLRQLPLWMVAFTSASMSALVLGGDVAQEARIPLRALAVVVFLLAILRQTRQLQDRDRLLAAERAVAEGQAQLQHLAHHDPLTGLPNRTLLRDRVTQALAAAARRDGKLALLFIDLDQFKEVNDTLGHAVGDALLCHVADAFTRLLREQDTICRQGGDEFAIVLSDIQSATDVAQAADRLMALSGSRALINGHELPLSMSVGIAIYPRDGADFDALMQSADTAMYRAKAAGRNAYRFYDPRMNVEASERSRLRWLLAHAIERDELHLHFQPYVELASGRVAGVEALLRWQSAELGAVGPDQFIPVAEDGGQIVEIGAWVLRQSCLQAAAWLRAGLEVPRVSVNVSILQFRHGDLVPHVVSALQASGLPAHHLELEITESVLMRETDKVLATADQLRQLGVRLAIDDFGAGYSSFAYLLRLSVHKLKIDRSFVHDAPGSAGAAAIVRAIVDMARALDLEVVAEGIETPAQRALLEQAFCAMGQGWLFARPMPADRIEAFLRAQVALAT